MWNDPSPVSMSVTYVEEQEVCMCVHVSLRRQLSVTARIPRAQAGYPPLVLSCTHWARPMSDLVPTQSFFQLQDKGVMGP